MNKLLNIVCLLLAAATATTLTQAQGLGNRVPSVIGLANIVRYQNTACANQEGESGTCLADAECTRRVGTSIGTCAHGYGSCCSFKVSM